MSTVKLVTHIFLPFQMDPTQSLSLETLIYLISTAWATLSGTPTNFVTLSLNVTLNSWWNKPLTFMGVFGLNSYNLLTVEVTISKPGI